MKPMGLFSRKKNKKAQMFDQIFVYILMLVVFSSILLFGFVAIKKLMSSSDTIDANRFKTSLKNLVDANIHYGTVQVETLNVPGNYREICFVDGCVYLNGTDSCANDAGTEFGLLNMNEAQYNSGVDAFNRKLYNHPLIENKIQGLTPSNVFLYPGGSDFYVGELVVVPNPANCNPDDTASCAIPTTPPYTFYDCMPVTQNKVQIRLEGLGNKVKVTYIPFTK